MNTEYVHILPVANRSWNLSNTGAKINSPSLALNFSLHRGKKTGIGLKKPKMHRLSSTGTQDKITKILQHVSFKDIPQNGFRGL